jgi:hypothetical protein
MVVSRTSGSRLAAIGGRASDVQRWLMLGVALLAGCAGASDAGNQPPWLARKIAEFEASPRASPPRSVLRTIYAGKTAYYVPPTCCDIPSELYDERGTLLCYPEGGFAGGDGRCPDFTLNAPLVVWQDQRAAVPKPERR